MANEGSSFEQQLTELEKVVDQLERGELSLEDSVALFERGMQLSESCKEQLATAESRIQVLLQPREKGPVRVKALDVEDEGADGDPEPDQTGGGFRSS